CSLLLPLATPISHCSLFGSGLVYQLGGGGKTCSCGSGLLAQAPSIIRHSRLKRRNLRIGLLLSLVKVLILLERTVDAYQRLIYVFFRRKADAVGELVQVLRLLVVAAGFFDHAKVVGNAETLLLAVVQKLFQ